MRTAPDEVALRALARMVEACGGAAYPPRFEQAREALTWLTSGKATPRGSRSAAAGSLGAIDGRILAREEAALAKEDPVLRLRAGEGGVWDRRFTAHPSRAPAARCRGRRWTQGLKEARPDAACRRSSLTALRPLFPPYGATALCCGPVAGLQSSDLAVS